MLKVTAIYILTIYQSLMKCKNGSTISIQKVSKPFHPLFVVSIRGCFQGLFCKSYSSGIPIDNNQEELDLVIEMANPLFLRFCSFFLSTVAEKSHLKYDVVLH